MKKEMLINISQAEECRIAILEDGQLEELFTERASQDHWANNIYKGKIVNIEASIQAAFVDFGVGRNGFLHISDVEPQYFRQAGLDPAEIEEGNFDEANDTGQSRNGSRRNSPSDFDVIEDEGEDGGRPQRGRGRRQSTLLRSGRPRNKPPIQDVFKRGDEVLVQVIKEGIGTKGPTLSTYISIPGRYVVLMPALGKVGISRKIENENARRKLRSIVRQIDPPKGIGFIVRTAGEGRTAKEIARDVMYLSRLWKVIVKRLGEMTSTGVLYEESDMVIRTIRDNFTSDIDSIVVDQEDAYQRASEFVNMTMPKFADRLSLYNAAEPIFHKYGLEAEINRIHQRVVPLSKGGSLVIDQTEALVAIDVNSGTFRNDESAEENAFQLNMLAAKEIARQLRLRDLGGVIVNDFIDMRKESHRRKVENTLRDSMRRDRAKTKILRTSPFGLIEMTRQRVRPSFKKSVYEDCPCCKGRGVVKTAESMALEVYRIIQLAAQTPNAAKISIKVNENVAGYLNNRKRRELMQIEEQTEVVILVLGSESQFPEQCALDVRDANGNPVSTPLLQSLQMN
jgi:ribonuclease E